VNDARKRKARRLKQAKEEALAEIERFKNERELQFKDYEAKHMGSRDDVALRIEKETKVRLTEMDRDVKMKKDKVIEDLLKIVICDVKPQLHKNLRLD
jgi:V-type H+-transporting ATPase subunit G